MNRRLTVLAVMTAGGLAVAVMLMHRPCIHASPQLIGPPQWSTDWRCHWRRDAAPKRAGQRHEGQQSDDRNDDDHHPYVWILEALAGDDECGGDIPLCRSQ